MSENFGTKETKEVITLVAAIAGFVYSEIQGDGLDLSDVGKLFLDSEFQVKIADALSGVSLVSDELADLDTLETLDVARFVLDAAENVVSSARNAA